MRVLVGLAYNILMRTALLIGLLAGCSGPPSLEVVRTASLPPGATELRLGETPLYRASYLFPIELKSSAAIPIHLTARLEEPAPGGVVVELTGETTLLPKGTGHVTLVLGPPKDLGPFAGKVALLSEDLPGWKHVYEFHGVVVDKPLPGKYLRAEPSGVDLGERRPGERVPFEVVLRNRGSEPVLVREWSPVEAVRVRLRRLDAPLSVEPGSEHRLQGELVAPAQAGAFHERVRILSDAKDPALDVPVFGSVVRDHELIPHRLDWGNVYRAEQPECSIRIRARPGVPPFTVGFVDGIKAHFDVVSPGGDVAAPEQTVRLRLKRNAPVGPLEGYEIRFHLEPGGEVLAWPLQVNVLPSIHAQPPEVDFGDVPRGAEPAREVRLLRYGNRSFEVSGIQCDNARFVVEKSRAAPLPWTVRVTLARGVGPGVHTGRILVETDDEDTPRLLIPVRVRVQ